MFQKRKNTAPSAEYAQMHDRQESVLGLVIQTAAPILSREVGYNCRALQCSVTVCLWQVEQSSGFLQLFLS